MRWLAAAFASSVCFCAAAFGTFVALARPDGVDYLFAWPGGPALVVASAIALALLLSIYGLVNLVARRHAPATLVDARSGRWLMPLVALAAVGLGIAPAIPGVGIRAAPLGYYGYDLRWWWLLALTVWVAVRADRVSGRVLERRVASLRSWTRARRLLALDAALFAAVIAWAIATSPRVRFTGQLNGDEPKYLRYCEVWYQGGGFAISDKKLFVDEPLDAPPRVLRTGALFVRALAEEGRALAGDLRRFAADPLGFRWNRVAGGDYFLTGKHGGVYQLHQPGLSLLLFPGYFLDRYLFGLHPGYGGEFPAELVMTNVTLLLLYGACAVMLFRFLRNALASELLAWVWAAFALVTLPAGAFAFQLYPEIPASLVIIAVSNHLLFHAREGPPSQSAAAGAASAALAWFHPRFLVVSICLAIAAMFFARERRRPFAVAYVLVLLSVCAYAYRATGSWLPTALWDANSFGFNARAVPINLVGYWFDRMWGLVPHSPLLIAALPGLVLFARRSMASAAFVLAVALALAIPAAAHSLSAAGGTPDRLVLAVLPLFVWPLALFVRRCWPSVTGRVLTIVLAILSLDAALSYNWTHEKAFGAMRDASASGWKPNLAFPDVREAPAVVTAIVIAVAVWSIGAAFLAQRTRRSVAGRRVWAPVAVVIVLVLLVGASAAASATTGRWVNGDYLRDEVAAHRAVARALVALDRCRICFTSRDGPTDWRQLEPNAARTVRADAWVQRRRAIVHASVEPRDRLAGFARLSIDFGDRSTTPWTGIVGERDVEHEYHDAGAYTIAVWLQLRDGSTHVVRQVVTVGR